MVGKQSMATSMGHVKSSEVVKVAETVHGNLDPYIFTNKNHACDQMSSDNITGKQTDCLLKNYKSIQTALFVT